MNWLDPNKNEITVFNEKYAMCTHVEVKVNRTASEQSPFRPNCKERDRKYEKVSHILLSGFAGGIVWCGLRVCFLLFMWTNADLKDRKRTKKVYSKYTRISNIINKDILLCFQSDHETLFYLCSSFYIKKIVQPFQYQLLLCIQCIYGDGMRTHFSLAKKQSFL